MTKKHSLLVVAIAAVVGAAVAASVAIGGGDNKTKPIAYAPLGSSSAPQPPAAALSQVLASSGTDAIVTARVGAPPSDVAKTTPWFYATVKAQGTASGLDVEPLWQADLVQGAVAELAGASDDLADDIGGSTLTLALPDGSSVDEGVGGMGDIARGQVFGRTPPGQVKAEVARAVRNAGLTPLTVRVMTPLGPAPLVIAEANDPARAAANYVATVRAVFGDPPQYEGYYLELRDTSGTAFIRGSAAFRTGAGRFWVAPQYQQIVGVKTLGRFGRSAG